MKHGILKTTTTTAVWCPPNRRPLQDLDIFQEFQLAKANSRKNSSISSPLNKQLCGTLKSGHLRVRFDTAADETALAPNTTPFLNKSDCCPGTGNVINETNQTLPANLKVEGGENDTSLGGETSCTSSRPALDLFLDKQDSFVNSIFVEWTELTATVDLFLSSTSFWLNQGHPGKK
jgi:hypothetical protein